MESVRLTWRDGVTSLLAGLTVLVAFAAVGGWGWPLLGSYRAATGVLAVVGISMCALGGPSSSASTRDTFTVLGSVLGVVALGLVVVALVTGAAAPFVALAGTIVLLWLIATVHHAIGPSVRTPVQTG
jgi:hypothetical protein